MFLQFFCNPKRRYIIGKQHVISVGRGVDKNPKTGSFSVGDRGVIELKDAKAKQMLKMYPKECEGYGKDAVIKKTPNKAKNAKPRTSVPDL